MTATNRRHDAMPGKNRSFRLFHAAVIATVGVVGLAYWPSMHAPFLFDDVLEIESNRALRVLWPPHVAMFQGGKLPHRPLAYYTFALNRLYGLDTFGFHAVNLGLHLVNGVLVGWLAAAASRRLCPQEERTETGWLGWAIATLWLLHPLCTQPVAYVYQRMELLGATAILTTLACFERSLQRPAHARGWQAGAVVACAIGMGCKEITVVAPVIVLIYDILTGEKSRSLAAAGFRRRLPMYAGLAATWGVLALVLWHERGRYAEFRAGQTDAWGYLVNQPAVILHYLALAVWPHPLCFDYGWPESRDPIRLMPAIAVVGGGVLATVCLACRRTSIAFLPLAFLVLLAPTSSIQPVSDLCVEHRMYLPLAAIIAFVVVSGWTLSRRAARSHPVRWRHFGLGAVALLVVVCAATTHARLHAYRTRLDLWRDTAAKRPDNPRAWLCIGRIFLDEGNAESAGIFFARALQLRPDYVDALFQMGNAVRGRSPEAALEWYRRTLALRPDHVDAHNNVAALLGIRGDPAAAEHLRIALAIDPVNVEAHSNFGNIMLASGRLAEARDWFAKAFALDPESPVTGQNLAVVERLLAAKAPPPRPSQGDPQ